MEEIIRNKKAELFELEEKIGLLHSDIWSLQDKVYKKRNKTSKKSRKEFIMLCPIEGCKGFLSTSYKCAVCEHFTCPNCFIDLGTTKPNNHTCDPSLVATVEILKKDSKPCPKCGIRTSKIDGCNQMWCTECHTPWNWRTGEIEKGIIHNPHYFAWRRNNSETGEIPRQPGDGGCNDLNINWNILKKICTYKLNSNGLVEYYNNINYNPPRIVDTIAQFYQDMIDLRGNIIPNLRLRYVNLQETNQKRVEYILNDIDDEEFASILYKNDRDALKLNDEINIYEMIQNVSADLLQNLERINLQHYLDRLRFCWNHGKLSGFKLTPHDLKGIMHVHELVESLAFELYNLIKYVNQQLRLYGFNYSVIVNLLNLSNYYNDTSWIRKISTCSRLGFKFTKTQLNKIPFEYLDSQLKEISYQESEFLTSDYKDSKSLLESRLFHPGDINKKFKCYNSYSDYDSTIANYDEHEFIKNYTNSSRLAHGESYFAKLTSYKGK
jgi:hypothetical protein